MKEDGGGITLKMGGDGTIFFDFERQRAIGGAAALNQPDNVPSGMACADGSASTCDDVIASDVTATFGRPVADPDGEAAWHFKMRVPVNPDAPHVDTRRNFHMLPGWAKFTDDSGNTLFRVPDEDGPYKDKDGRYRVERTPIVTDLATTLAADPARAEWKPLEASRAQRIDRGRPSEELGVYNLWLSNYAGGAGTDADPHRYLEYAALRPVQLPGLLDPGNELRACAGVPLRLRRLQRRGRQQAGELGHGPTTRSRPRSTAGRRAG